MDQTTHDRLQFLSTRERAYAAAISYCRQAVGQVESTPGSQDATKILERAVAEIDKLRKPVHREMQRIRSEAAAGAPKREGFRSLG